MQKADFDYISLAIDEAVKTNDINIHFETLLNVCRQLQAAYRNQDVKAILRHCVTVVYESELYLRTLQMQSVLETVVNGEISQNLALFKQYHFEAFIGDKWSGVLGFKATKSPNMVYDMLHHAWFLGCAYDDKQEKLLMSLVKSKQVEPINFFD